MPAHLDPIQAHQDGEVTVQMQCCNRRPSTHGTSDDFCAICTPLEMALPLLAAWVKEAHPAACYGVSAMRLLALGAVTQPTGQPQVCLLVAPTTDTRCDMLNMQRVVDILLMRPTVPTAIASLGNNPCARKGAAMSVTRWNLPHRGHGARLPPLLLISGAAHYHAVVTGEPVPPAPPG